MMGAEAWRALLVATWEALHPIALGVLLGWQLNDGFAARRQRKERERV